MKDYTAHQYKKIPVTVWAMKFQTNSEQHNENMNAICIWINQGNPPEASHAWHNGTDIFIQTLEGTMRASCGDWIIKGVNGEFYPCKEDIFNKTYEAI